VFISSSPRTRRGLGRVEKLTVADAAGPVP